MRRTAVLAMTLVCSCADEREACRADAIDVEGQWSLTSPTLADAVVDIRAETDINDVRAVLRRGDSATAISADEADVIGRLVNANDRLLARTALEVGTGIDAVRTELVGGENISCDGGSTVTLEVVSGAYAAFTDGDNSLVRWGLSLSGDADSLEGELFVTERFRVRTVGTSDTDFMTQRSTSPVVLTRR